MKKIILVIILIFSNQIYTSCRQNSDCPGTHYCKLWKCGNRQSGTICSRCERRAEQGERCGNFDGNIVPCRSGFRCVGHNPQQRTCQK